MRWSQGIRIWHLRAHVILCLVFWSVVLWHALYDCTIWYSPKEGYMCPEILNHCESLWSHKVLVPKTLIMLNFNKLSSPLKFSFTWPGSRLHMFQRSIFCNQWHFKATHLHDLWTLHATVLLYFYIFTKKNAPSRAHTKTDITWTFLTQDSIPPFYAPPPKKWRDKKWRDIMLYPVKIWVSVCPSVRQRPHHSFARNSSYSFRPILLKLYRRF